MLKYRLIPTEKKILPKTGAARGKGTEEVRHRPAHQVWRPSPEGTGGKAEGDGTAEGADNDLHGHHQDHGQDQNHPQLQYLHFRIDLIREVQKDTGGRDREVTIVEARTTDPVIHPRGRTGNTMTGALSRNRSRSRNGVSYTSVKSQKALLKRNYVRGSKSLDL